MELHLELKTREFMEGGMAEQDACNAARRQFGNLTARQEESRETWLAPQTRDIGIPVALGARRAQVLGMVLRQGLTLTLAGAAIGLGAALVLSRVTASLLYGVSPTDSATFLAVPAVLMTIAAAACLVPARRAAALDPIPALRGE